MLSVNPITLRDGAFANDICVSSALEGNIYCHNLPEYLTNQSASMEQSDQSAVEAAQDPLLKVFLLLHNDASKSNLYPCISCKVSCYNNFPVYQSPYSTVLERYYSLKSNHVLSMREYLSCVKYPLGFPVNLYECESEVSDKVDGNMRDSAVYNLIFLHKVYFDEGLEVFCQAVNIIDRFLTKVKVKSIYLLHTVAAAYYLAMELRYKMVIESADAKKLMKELINLCHCKGNVDDLKKMIDIIVTKLGKGRRSELYSPTPATFLCLYLQTLKSIHWQDQPAMKLLNKREAIRDLEKRVFAITCSLHCYEFSYDVIAMSALLLQFHGQNRRLSNSLKCFFNVDSDLDRALNSCQQMMKELYDQYVRNTLPCSQKKLSWVVSRSTCSFLTLRKPMVDLYGILEAED